MCQTSRPSRWSQPSYQLGHAAVGVPGLPMPNPWPPEVKRWRSTATPACLQASAMMSVLAGSETGSSSATGDATLTLDLNATREMGGVRKGRFPTLSPRKQPDRCPPRSDVLRSAGVDASWTFGLSIYVAKPPKKAVSRQPLAHLGLTRPRHFRAGRSSEGSARPLKQAADPRPPGQPARPERLCSPQRTKTGVTA